MNVFKRVLAGAMVASALLSTLVLASTKADLDEAMSHDGLQKISVKGVDLAYARPGATLAGYNRIKLDPVQVAFRKDWDPTRTGSSIKLTQEDRENIRTGVAKIVQEEFVKELQSKSIYKVVDELGPDVLRVRVHIVNLYVAAPDTGGAGRSRTYTVSAGEMTLFAELFDSETGETLARVVDRRVASSAGGRMTLSNSATNRAEAQDIASSWARILRTALDNAHGVGKK
jgi:hypothetical protein